MNTLVIFSGLPGTGKSTLAHRLAYELQWPLLCIDDVLGEIPENPTVAFWDSKVAILLGLAEVQIELGLSVIVDSVFMNTDRHHAQQIAAKYGAHFRPIYTLVSNDQVWEQRVTERYESLNNKNVATWEDVQRQRGHFRDWEAGTALFMDALDPVEENYADVLSFVMSETVDLKPLEDIPWAIGAYHGSK
jgi:predicted kinase